MFGSIIIVIADDKKEKIAISLFKNDEKKTFSVYSGKKVGDQKNNDSL